MNLKFYVFDAAGDERFRVVFLNIKKKVEAIIIVYSI
jgi:GTPase SAR1 family protein